MATVHDIQTVPASGDYRVDALLKTGTNWNYVLPTRNVLYYTFDIGLAIESSVAALGAFNTVQQAAARQLLLLAQSVTGIQFAEVASGTAADFHFATANLSGATTTGLCSTNFSYSYLGTGEVTAYSAEAYVYLDNTEFALENGSPTAGTAGYQVLLHEIGHALGLGHPFEASPPLPSGEDNTGNTVMSYTWTGDYKTAFQSFDLLALQWIFGGDGLAAMDGINSVRGPSLTIPPANQAPQGGADSFTVDEDVPFSGNVLTNDHDPEGQALSTSLRATVGRGSLSLLADGRFTYVPQQNFSGTDSFVYTLSDGGASVDVAVTLTVRPVNDRPVAQSDTFSVARGAALVGQVLTNDGDVDGQTLTAILAQGPTHGRLALESDGTFVYVPDSGYAGMDSFSYQASDGALTAPATVAVNVATVANAPAFAVDSVFASGDEGWRVVSGASGVGRLPTVQASATLGNSSVLSDAVDYWRAPAGFLGDHSAALGERLWFDLQMPGASTGGDLDVVLSGAGSRLVYRLGQPMTEDWQTWSVPLTASGWQLADTGAAVDVAAFARVLAALDGVFIRGERGAAGVGSVLDNVSLRHFLTVTGTAASDTLTDRAGSERIDGAAGSDTLVFAVTRDAAQVGWQSGSWLVATGRDNNVLTGIENLRFNDQVIALAPTWPLASPGYNLDAGFLFDPVFYSVSYGAFADPQLALAQYFSMGATAGRQPNAWFDADFYRAHWPDLAALGLDAATAFRHYNLYGVWEGRSAGAVFDAFDGVRYLNDNPDVAAYVDGHLPDFLGSRSNGALAHWIIYGADEGRVAYEAGNAAPIDLGYLL